MNRFWMMIVALVCSMALSAHALGQHDFYTYSNYVVNPDLNSGTVYGVSNSRNAVVMNISSFSSYSVDQSTGLVYVDNNMYLSGVWGDPNTASPYYNFLETHGLTTASSLQLTSFVWNGQMYEYETLVSVGLSGEARLFRDLTQNTLHGYSNFNVWGIGAIPVRSTASYQIYETTNPTSGAD